MGCLLLVNGTPARTGAVDMTSPTTNSPAVAVDFTTNTQRTSIERLLELLFGQEVKN